MENLKYLDQATQHSITALPTDWCLDPAIGIRALNGVANGTTENTRVGDTIAMHSIRIRLKLIWKVLVTDTDLPVVFSPYSPVRILIVIDTQTNNPTEWSPVGILIPPQGGVEPDPILWMEDPLQWKRYKILYDETFSPPYDRDPRLTLQKLQDVTAAQETGYTHITAPVRIDQVGEAGITAPEGEGEFGIALGVHQGLNMGFETVTTDIIEFHPGETGFQGSILNEDTIAYQIEDLHEIYIELDRMKTHYKGDGPDTESIVDNSLHIMGISSSDGEYKDEEYLCDIEYMARLLYWDQ